MNWICLLLVATLWAGQPGGVLVGLITTPSGEALRHKRIVLVDGRAGARRAATTNASGIFAFDLLPPGAYRIEAAHGRLLSPSGDRIVLRSNEKRSWRLVWQAVSPADPPSHID